MKRIKIWMKTTIAGQLARQLILGLLSGLILSIILFGGLHQIADNIIMSLSHPPRYEEDLAEALQKDIRRFHLKSTDSSKLLNWAREHHLTALTVYDGTKTQFSYSNQQIWSLLPGNFEKQSFTIYYSLHFDDKRAYVAIRGWSGAVFYELILVFSLLCGFALCLLILIREIEKKTSYIQALKLSAGQIGQGTLTHKIPVQGHDEITELAGSLDKMRHQLLLSRTKEAEMKAAEDKMALGMSHDLRTPLTSLMAYLELIQNQPKGDPVNSDYLTKAMDKTLEIRSLSDQIFEYFLIKEPAPLPLDEPDTIENILGDSLSDFCAVLTMKGFQLNAGTLEFKPLFIQVNSDYIGRIHNNLLSNMLKYADSACPIQLRLCYTDNEVILIIKNKTLHSSQHQAENGIGVKNIQLMMQKMAGKLVIFSDADFYEVQLSFPVISEVSDVKQ